MVATLHRCTSLIGSSRLFSCSVQIENANKGIGGAQTLTFELARQRSGRKDSRLMPALRDRGRRVRESIRTGRLPRWAPIILGVCCIGSLLCGAVMFVPLGEGFLGGGDGLDLLVGSVVVVVLLATGTGLLRLAVRRSGHAK
jgi:hypothetical protein